MPSRLALAALALLCAAPFARADEGSSAEEANQRPPEPIALRGVIDVAVRSNPGLAKTVVDVAIADAAVLEAGGLDDFQIDATLSWSSLRITPVDVFTPRFDDQFTLQGGLTRALPDGTTLSLHASTGYERRDTLDFNLTTGEPSRRQADIYAESVTARVTKPLLRGGGRDVGRAAARRANAGRNVAELQRRASASTLVRDLITAYWEVAFAERDLEIRRGSLELAEEQRANTRAAIEVGTVPATEALAVDQVIATREEEILLAEVAVSERSLELRRLSGMEIGPGAIDVTASDPLDIANVDIDMDVALGQALAANPDVALLEARGENASIDVEVSEDGLAPQLDLSVNGGPSSSVDGSAGDALTQVAKFDNYQVGASLTYRQSIGNRAARGANERAHEGLRRVKMDLTEARAQVAVSTVRAVNLVRSARKRIEVSEKAIRLAEQNLANEKARFELGRSTNFDVLQRQEELQQSRLRNARATIDYLNSIALVEALTGAILPKYGVDVAK